MQINIVRSTFGSTKFETFFSEYLKSKGLDNKIYRDEEVDWDSIKEPGNLNFYMIETGWVIDNKHYSFEDVEDLIPILSPNVETETNLERKKFVMAVDDLIKQYKLIAC